MFVDLVYSTHSALHIALDAYRAFTKTKKEYKNFKKQEIHHIFFKTN